MEVSEFIFIVAVEGATPDIIGISALHSRMRKGKRAIGV